MTRLAPAIARLLERPEAERRLGSFFLVKPLGHGGFAPVWLAKERVGTAELRTAAVKLFPLDGAGEEFGEAGSSGRKRIVEEARALCKVEHPNVVRFYTLCVDEAAGVLGLAMEYLAGTPLGEQIAAAGCLPVDETIRVGIAIASALSAVHRAKIVHRDVKPSNVVDAAGVYKLIDFGIAAAETLNAPEPPRDGDPDIAHAAVSASGTELQGGDATLRVVGFQSGTQGYIDPVCFATGAPASSASDLYALGAMLFECLTGKLPAAAAMPGTGQSQRSVLVGRAAPPALRSLVPEVPVPLADLVDSMVAPLRHTRPPSAEWVALRLKEIRLERQAEAAWAGFERTRPEAARAARMVLLALTTPEGTRATRSMKEIAIIAGADAEQVIDSLSSAGITVTGGPGVTLADDALTTHWGRLRQWLEATREDRLLAEELERDAKRWLADVNAVPLWQKRRLAFAEDLRGRADLYLSDGAIAFLQASRRAERRVRAGIAVAAVVVALSPAGAGFGYWRATAAHEVPTHPAPTHANPSPRPVVAQDEPRDTKPSPDASVPPAGTTNVPPARVTAASVRTTETHAGTTKSIKTSRPDAAPSTSAPPPAGHDPTATTPTPLEPAPLPPPGPATAGSPDATVPRMSEIFD